MDSPATILFTCRCKHVLEAPAEWKGRQVQCTLCRSTILVPEQNDPEAVRRDLDQTERMRRAQRAWKQTLAGTSELRAAAPPALPPPGDARTVALESADAKTPLRWSRRSWAIAIPAVLVVPAAAIGVLWFVNGREVPRLPSRGPAAAAVKAEARSRMQELGFAEQAYEKSNHGFEQAQRLAELYRTAATIPAQPRARSHVCNNAAWFFATTPHPSLRDPQLALDLARIAVDLSAGQDPNMLDTLAEALFVNRRFSEAVETQKKTLAMMPDAGADFVERYRKYQDSLTTR